MTVSEPVAASAVMTVAASVSDAREMMALPTPCSPMAEPAL